jgi:hypothetical protein
MAASALKMEAARFSETLASTDQSTRRLNPKEHHLSLNFLFVAVTKFIRIGIADKNDNPPFFDKALYEAEVDENEDIQHTVLTVTAKDHDECEYRCLLLSSLSGGIRGSSVPEFIERNYFQNRTVMDSIQ